MRLFDPAKIYCANGFLDILLHVGLVGFVVASAVSFPLLIVLYACIANIAFSLFAETELLVWFLVVVVLLMTTPRFGPVEPG